MSANDKPVSSAANPFLVQDAPVAERAIPVLEGPTALEISIAWGDDVLHVAHHAPARDVFVGDDEAGPVAFRVPAEKLGAARVPLARVEGGSIVAYVPRGEAKLEGASLACTPSEIDGWDRVVLPFGTRVRFSRGDLLFSVGHVAAEKKPTGKSKARRAVLAFAAISAAVHGAIMAAMMMSPGASLDDENAGLDQSTQAYLTQMQVNHADKEISKQESEGTADSETNGGSGARHAGAEGASGDPSKQNVNAHYEIKGPPDTTEVKLAKVHALIESNNYGAVGALASVFGATANMPVAFDADDAQAIGRDAHNFNGHITGDHGGDSFGYNGLGMTSTGPGGGGLFNGLGVGTFGDYGHGSGTCDEGPCNGWGGGPSGKGLKRKQHDLLKVIDQGGDTVGKLPPETIKRVIRANFPRFRACYESGLKKDPGLRGSVKVRFIIDTTGAVESASLGGGTMPDANVQSCVLGVYKTLSFPEPESGKVMVNYPIDFDNE